MVRRIRSIKPEFFENELLAALPYEHRLLFAGLWTVADKAGRLEDRPTRIKARLLPYDDLDIDAMLAKLAEGPDPFIARYVVDGQALIFILKFSLHQRPHSTERDSVLPAYKSPDLRRNRRKSGNNGYATGTKRLRNGALTEVVTAVTHKAPQKAKTGGANPPGDEVGKRRFSSKSLREVVNNGYATVTQRLDNRSLTLGSGSGEDQDQDPVPALENSAGTAFARPARASRRGLPAKQPSAEPEGFAEVWAAYPNKKSRITAVIVFAGLAPSAATAARMVEAIAEQQRTPSWQEAGGKFIPHLAKWLREERWTDELPDTTPPASRERWWEECERLGHTPRCEHAFAHAIRDSRVGEKLAKA